MKKVRVGILGTGGIFRGAHLPGYLQVPNAQIVAVQDVNKDSLLNAERALKAAFTSKSEEEEKKGKVEEARRWKDDLNQIKLYENAEEMLAKEELDLVDICTPPSAHADLSIQALKSGVNVMCEKPMAISYLDCLEVVKAVEETGKFYQHNENWIYDPSWYTAKKFIDGGAIGEVLLIFLAAAHGGPEWRGWFWNPEISGGGALLDNGVHAITTSWYLAGFERKPLRVKTVRPYGLTTRMKKRILEGYYQDVKVEDDAHIIIEYEPLDAKAWVTAHIEGSWSERDSQDTIIIGSNGSMSFEKVEGETILRIEDPWGNVRKININKTINYRPGMSSFAGEIKNMCNCILNNTRPFCDEKIGATSTALVGAAYLSQIKGMRPVTLKEFEDYALEFKGRKNELIKNLMKAVEV